LPYSLNIPMLDTTAESEIQSPLNSDIGLARLSRQRRW
jgi:hypothetical protein